MLVDSFRIVSATFIILWIAGPYGVKLELGVLAESVEDLTLK
jgi:hypothetical protein